jgi:hypothetical protein
MKLTAIIHRKLDALRFAWRVTRMLWGLAHVFQSISISLEVAALEDHIEFPKAKPQEKAA